MDTYTARGQVAFFLRRLYERHLTTTSGGNVSCRCEEDRFAITPGRLDKACVVPEQVAVLTLSGTNETPDIVPSSEWFMHALIYRRLPSVNAIVHGHPTTASAFACSDMPIRRDLMCETYALLDPLVKVPYARSGSEELALRVAEAAVDSSCLLLQNHGVLTTGDDLLQAFTRLELVEEAARVTLVAFELGGLRFLSEADCRELDAYVGRTQGDAGPTS